MSAAPLSLRPKSGAARVKDIGFRISMLLCLALSALVLVTLIVDVLIDALPVLGSRLFTNFPSSNAEIAGLQPAIFGTLWIIGVCAVFIVPIGVATAVYLEEYADNSKWWNRLIEVNIQNLAAVPSIVYGILGLAFLVRGPLSLGRVVLAGGLTLGLLVLPVVIIAGREAIRAVPPSIREGSMALGATQVADDLEAGPAGVDPGRRDRRDPRAVARDRRDGAADRRRRRDVHHVQPERHRRRRRRLQRAARSRSSAGSPSRRTSSTSSRRPASCCCSGC